MAKRRHKRPRSRQQRVVVTVLAALAVGLTLALVTRRYSGPVLVPTRARNGSAVSTEGPLAIVVGDRLVIPSLDRWVEVVTGVVQRHLEQGDRDPARILTAVLQTAAPSSPWPPPRTSPLWIQWQLMVADIAALLQTPPPPIEPRRDLHVVA